VTIVLDANVLIVLVGHDPRRAVADTHLRRWIESGEDLHAPMLALYEVANGLTRLVSAGAFPGERLAEAWNAVLGIPITYHPLEAGDEVVKVALRLSRSSAYDASYLRLAEQLGADLWTFDGPLARNASSVGFSVHLLL
jgi:predicted nucleic acid-binding protein